MRLLFVTWDGPATTYHRALFMPLLARATGPDDEVHLLQFTWDAAQRSTRNAAMAEDLGMRFTAQDFGQQPSPLLVPAWIVRGGMQIARTVREHRLDTVLARSIIPGAMALVTRTILRDEVELIYDADGLMADERVEFGGWKKRGLRYRLFTAVERTTIRHARSVLVRTDRAAAILQRRTGVEPTRFHVVRNVKDERMYEPGTPRERAAIRESLGVPLEAPLLAYVGSIGPQYQPRRMMALFSHVASRRADARLLVLTSERNHGLVVRLCEPDLRERLIVLEADPAEIPRYLAPADVGLAFRQATLSQSAVSPIKVGEYLLCGLPVIYSSGVGGLDDLLRAGPALAVDDDGEDVLRDATAWILDEILPSRDAYRIGARERGLALYSLDVGAKHYGAALRG